MPARFNQITTEAQLDALFKDSYTHPVALIKHSDTCGISANVMYDLKEIDADINVIVIQHDFGFRGQPIWTLYAHLSAALVRRGGYPIDPDTRSAARMINAEADGG